MLTRTTMLLAGLVAPATAALAQGGIERPSGGAQTVQPFPDFAEPAPREGAPPPPATPPAPPSADSGAVRIDRVAVSLVGGPPSAPARLLPLPRWTPAPDAGSDIILVHSPGQPLDWRWVEAQFAANGMVGATVPSDRIWSLIQRINLAYVQNGYINSGVLLGGSADGILRLDLILGHIAKCADGKPDVRIRFVGPRRGLTPGFIAARMPSARDVPLNIRRIERDFRLLADDPAIRTTQTDLRPGTAPGEAGLDIAVDPARRGDILLTFGNSRSPSVGETRVGIAGYLRHIAVAGDQLSLDYGRTRGLDDVSGYYAVPVLGPSTLLRLRGGYNGAAVTDPELALLAIRSREWVAEGGIEQKVLRRPLLPTGQKGEWFAAQEASIGVTVTHRRLETELLGLPFSFSPGAKDGRTEYSALRLIGQYVRRSPTTVLSLSLTGSFGLGGTQSLLAGQKDAEKRFTTLFAQANYAHRLNAHQTELRIRLAGQVASGLLYTSERLGVGGLETVRGYRENLLLGDQALVGSVELAQPFRLAPRSANDALARAATVTVSALADGAVLRNLQSGQPLARSIAAVGVGLAWNPTDWLRASGNYAHPLRFVMGPGERSLQDRGLTFRLTVYPLGLLGI